jgi:hypothetical protein
MREESSAAHWESTSGENVSNEEKDATQHIGNQHLEQMSVNEGRKQRSTLGINIWKKCQ